MQQIYPFKFLDSYKREDKDFFFGRTDEIESLYSMIFKTRILLIYGTSGTGKTSLIQCGLANKFQTYDWLALYIRRGTNLLASLDKALCQESDDQYTYTEQQESKIPNLKVKIEAVHKASFKPIYLIFDQFEELFILGSKEEQKQFIQAIKEILSFDQPVKIIFSIREEYLGHLYDFEKVIPDLLNKKLRVEPMNLEKVKSVIKNIGLSDRSIVQLKDGEEEQIGKGIFENLKGEQKSLTIELPYLQVFLDSFYLKITNDQSRKTEALFSVDALNKMGNIGDVLRNFLDDQVKVIANEHKQKSEQIWKFLSPFVTLDGTKEPLTIKQLFDRFPDESPELLTKVVKAFVDNRILRYSEKDEYYEIAHDSLGKQINSKRSIEEKAVMEVKQLIGNQVAAKKNAREYFTERQLSFIDPYLDKFTLSKEEDLWISESRSQLREIKEKEKMAQQEKLAKAKKQLRVVLGLLILTGFFLIYAIHQRSVALLYAKSAIVNKIEAEEAKSNAQTILKTYYNSEIKRYENEKNRINEGIEEYKRLGGNNSLATLAAINTEQIKIKRNQSSIDSLNKLINNLK